MRNRRRDNSKLVKKYRKEPKVEIIGSTVYQQHLGRVYTFTYNGFPVSIKFDGTAQKFPKTIAKIIQKKLNAIAEANAPKSVNVEING